MKMHSAPVGFAKASERCGFGNSEKGLNLRRCRNSARVERTAISTSGGGFLFGVVLAVFLLVFTTQSTLVQAKRGCANFGHSCYGGMGKRANALTDEYLAQDTNGVDGSEQDDPALVFTGPRSVLRPMRTHFLQPGHQFSEQAKMDGANAINGNIMGIHGEHIKMSPYLQQMLRFYKNMQNIQNRGDGLDGK